MDFSIGVTAGMLVVVAFFLMLDLFTRKRTAREYRPPINANIWKAKDGWRVKVGYPIPGTLDTDWKYQTTESYDSYREARADLKKIICTGWTIEEVDDEE